MESGFVGAVPRIRHDPEGSAKEDLLRLRLAHLVLVAALARIARVPVESSNASPIDHRRILPSYTTNGSIARAVLGAGGEDHSPEFGSRNRLSRLQDGFVCEAEAMQSPGANLSAEGVERQLAMARTHRGGPERL